MIAGLLPEIVACAEIREDIVDGDLFPEEQAVIARAVEKRRREFTTGRACARRALAQLGVPPGPIPSGAHGEPVWPSGIVGSLTHCARYRACAVARADAIATIGIDAEPNRPLPDGVLEDVASERERALVTGGSSHVDIGRLLFSAKEAVYKAWFPLTGRWLGFFDAELSIDLTEGTFRARLLVPGPVIRGSRLDGFDGRWAAEDGIVATAIAVL